MAVIMPVGEVFMMVDDANAAAAAAAGDDDDFAIDCNDANNI